MINQDHIEENFACPNDDANDVKKLFAVLWIVVFFHQRIIVSIIILINVQLQVLK